MFKKIGVILPILFGLTGCQMGGDPSMDIDFLSPKTIVTTYILTHGMCMGYLESQPEEVSDIQFKTLFQEDQAAKQDVLMALIHPNQRNLEQARQSIRELISLIQGNNRETDNQG